MDGRRRRTVGTVGDVSGLWLFFCSFPPRSLSSLDGIEGLWETDTPLFLSTPFSPVLRVVHFSLSVVIVNIVLVCFNHWFMMILVAVNVNLEIKNIKPPKALLTLLSRTYSTYLTATTALPRFEDSRKEIFSTKFTHW